MKVKSIHQRIAVSLIITTLALTGLGCHSDTREGKSAMTGETMMPQKDIVDTAVGAGDFNTLATALKAAGLVDTLKGPGPFTVFAPTDAAFAELPPGTVEDLLKPQNKEKLVSILTYHVVPQKVMAAAVFKMNSAKTVNGQTLTIRSGATGVMVDDARVVTTDIGCANGVIHVIDAVMLPE